MKLVLTHLFLLVSVTCSFAQEANRDTLPLNEAAIEQEVDAFLRALEIMKKGESYFFVGAGIGNRQFSLQNAALNLQQASSPLVITPTAGYVHRSGLGISYLNYISVSGTAKGVLQHAVSASYTLMRNTDLDAGVFYTTYFGKQDYISQTSPYDHDVFAYLSAKKGVLQPGIAFGWATGSFSDIARIDTFVRIGFPPVRLPVTITDTARFKISDFSMIGTLRHAFTWKGLNENHAVLFTPQLLLIAASSRTDITSVTTITDRRMRLTGTRFASRRSQNNSSAITGFQLQSLGLSLDFAYYFNKVYVNPQLYLDYYLGKIADRRLSGLFSINLGVML